jgi:hypothetical protein
VEDRCWSPTISPSATDASGAPPGQ